MIRECAKTLLPSKLLVDADAWKFWGKNESYISAPPLIFKNRSRDTALCWLRIEPTYFFFRTATLKGVGRKFSREGGNGKKDRKIALLSLYLLYLYRYHV